MTAPIIAFVLLAALFAVFMVLTARREDAWARERRELLNRIQHPQIVPSTTSTTSVPSPPEPDEFDLIGTKAEPPEEQA